MANHVPPNAQDVRSIIEDRLNALDEFSGAQESVTVEWRGAQIHIPVISMPVGLLHYNPGTHRIRAQRSIDSELELELMSHPYSTAAQGYLHQLLTVDPAAPTKRDQSFEALKDDLAKHGQTDPGIVTRLGILINGNTRRAALKELGHPNIRVGVLPPDAGHEDLQSIELSLQLRKDLKRDYSFMNFLLAIDERSSLGELAVNIQKAFRINAKTYDDSRWILEFIRDAIERSKVTIGDKQSSLRLLDFEMHQGKLEELCRAYKALKQKAPDEAEALREQRLLALVLDKSKTDLRLIEPDFVSTYMKGHLPVPTVAPPVKIPGTSITAPPLNQNVQALRELTTNVLKAKSVGLAGGAASPAEVTEATAFLGNLTESLNKALDRAGKTTRVQKRRLAAAERLSETCDDLELAVNAVAEARATGNFDPEDLSEALISLRSSLDKLATIVVRGSDSTAEGIAWLHELRKLSDRIG